MLTSVTTATFHSQLYSKHGFNLCFGSDMGCMRGTRITAKCSLVAAARSGCVVRSPAVVVGVLANPGMREGGLSFFAQPPLQRNTLPVLLCAGSVLWSVEDLLALIAFLRPYTPSCIYAKHIFASIVVNALNVAS